VGGWMSSVPTAAQDPIFYLHHANVDRLWNLWLAQGGGRTDPLSNATWKNHQYTFFDEGGNAVKMTACDILRCAEQLSYVYECEPIEVREYCLRLVIPWQFVWEVLIQLPIPPIELAAEPVSFPIELQKIQARLSQILGSKDQTLFLELDNVEAEAQPGVVWEVFVGLPAGAEANAKSPYFVGSLSLFGSGVHSEAHGEFKPAHFLYPLNRALREALKTNPERLTVTFVPVGVLVNGKSGRLEVKSPVRIGKASLTIQIRKEQAGGQPG
jgi:Common central domain of tyrosinase/Polyphenol oxidase middle domain